MKSLKSIANVLVKRDPLLRRWVRRIGDCNFTPDNKRSIFEALVRAVAHQQLHGNAARSILARFMALIKSKDSRGFPTPQAVVKIDSKKLRSVGFSNAKVLAIKDIAKKVASGDVPTIAQTHKMSDIEIINTLIPLRGVGRWTAEMILISTLGRMDVLPVDDFGIREGFRIMHGKNTQPKPKDLAKFGERWAPYRTIVSWYLWRIADIHKKVGTKS
jgi:DNA-3-methyladenine glycosylase II